MKKVWLDVWSPWHSTLTIVRKLQIHLLNPSCVEEEVEFVDEEFQEDEVIDEEFQRENVEEPCQGFMGFSTNL
jgi:hypothetical protein